MFRFCLLRRSGSLENRQLDPSPLMGEGVYISMVWSSVLVLAVVDEVVDDTGVSQSGNITEI